MKQHKNIFLLGGKDLEMSTIKKILCEQRQIVYDKGMDWNKAFLSQYSTELSQFGNNQEYIIYGIELIEKGIKQIPGNYHRIDHHNEYSDRPSSLEQVALLLKISLNREQALIAANDKAYIPGMQAIGASEEEINRIRLADRRAQGVSEEDEELAQKAIQDKKMEEGIIVVHSETNRFAPITDRLFPYEQLLIYTSDELIYYGKGKDLLVKFYAKEIEAGRMFHGGGKQGFIGAARSAYSENELKDMKKQIIYQLKV